MTTKTIENDCWLLQIVDALVQYVGVISTIDCFSLLSVIDVDKTTGIQKIVAMTL